MLAVAARVSDYAGYGVFTVVVRVWCVEEFALRRYDNPSKCGLWQFLWEKLHAIWNISQSRWVYYNRIVFSCGSAYFYYSIYADIIGF